VLVDGKLVGSFAFSSGGRDYGGISEIYLMSDFPVAPTDYPRLSKLVLYAALSHESKLLAERITRHRVRTIYTTAFSNKPVSMKYRNLFHIVNRKENPAWTPDATGPGAHYEQRYLINYKAPMGQWSLAEGLAEWKAKYGERAAGHHPAHSAD
jgi:hypothetical protein